MTASLGDQLKHTALFAGFTDRQIQGVLAVAKERRFGAGEHVIRRGEDAVGFYLIVEGSAEVRSGDTVLAHLGAGDFFGEMALLLEGTTRTADVTALDDTTCLVVTQWAFKSLLAAHPDTALAVMGELARRLRNTPDTLSD
jgi:CRP/FNR family cyclic AMP-dependent transcriptional regulator